MKCRPVVFLFGWVLLFECAQSARARAHEQTPGILKALVEALNAGNVEGATAVMIEEPAITDDVPPFCWHGKGAIVSWLKDVLADMVAHHHTGRKIELGNGDFSDRLGDNYYQSATVTVTYRPDSDGTMMTEHGLIAVSIVHVGNTLLISSLTYARDPMARN